MILSFGFEIICSYELILLSTFLEHIKIPIGNLKIWTPCIMICMWEYAVFSYYRYSSYFVFIHFRMFFMFPYYARFNSVRIFSLKTRISTCTRNEESLNVLSSSYSLYKQDHWLSFLIGSIFFF